MYWDQGSRLPLIKKNGWQTLHVYGVWCEFCELTPIKSILSACPLRLVQRLGQPCSRIRGSTSFFQQRLGERSRLYALKQTTQQAPPTCYYCGGVILSSRKEARQPNNPGHEATSICRVFWSEPITSSCGKNRSTLGLKAINYTRSSSKIAFSWTASWLWN